MAKSLGTLTLDLIAKIGGFTAGMTEAERAADKSARKIEASIKSIGIASLAVGTAIGQTLKQGIDAAVNAFPELIDLAGQFADIADKTGGSAEGFANFAVSAKVAGVSMDDIANASTRLSKALIGVDDESKAAGAGLSALGINIKDFKSLSADQQIKKVAESFAQFADGTEKAAVAQQIFGKTGAELLKFFKDYTDNGGDANILTGEMIQKSDDFADALTRQRTELSLFASAAATNFIDPMNSLIKVVKDAITEVYGLDKASTVLGANSGIQAFADDVGRQLAKVVDYIVTTKRELATLNDFGNSLDKSLKTFSLKPLAEFQDRHELDAFFRGKDASIDTANQGLTNTLSGKQGKAAAGSFVEAYEQELARTRNDRNRAALNGVNYGAGADNRPKLRPDAPTTGGGKKDNSVEQEAKAQLASDLDAIKNAQEVFRNAYANSGKVLEAMRSAGLTDEKEYYQQRKALLDQDTKAQIDAQEQTIGRLQAEKVSGKEAIDNAKKIADAQSQLTKIRADAATQSKILGIQEESSYRKIASALLAARQAAQDYFDTVNEGYASELAGIGQGSKNREFQAALQQINEKYQQQRQTLANQRAQAELTAGGPLSADAAKQFDDQLAIINEFQSKSLESYKRHYADIDAAQKDWTNGATEALKNYADEAANTAKLTEQVFSNAFQSLEDALVDFVKTGKLDFKSLVDSILADMLRMAVKQQITGPLSNWLGGAIGGMSSSSGGSGGGDALGALISMNGWATGGYTGNGAPNDPAGIVHKGEYVLNAEQTKRIGVANLDRGEFGGSGGYVQNLTYVIEGKVDRRTQDQLANDARRKASTVAMRFS